MTKPACCGRWPGSLPWLGCFWLAGCEVMAALAPVVGGILSTQLQNHGHEQAARTFETFQAALLKQFTATTAASASVAVRLEVQLLQRTIDGDRELLRPMVDGDELHNRGDAEAADEFVIYVKPSTTCFLYVIAVDATGWIHPLFPVDARGRQLAAGQTVVLPEARESAFYPDRFAGKETIYFVASPSRRLDLEDALQPFVGRERSDGEFAARVADVAADNLAIGVMQRSLAEGRVRGQSVVVESVLAQAGSDLVLTRWFWNR